MALEKQRSRGEVGDQASEKPAMAELPESWKTNPDGTPVPNWVAAIYEARRDTELIPERTILANPPVQAGTDGSREYPRDMPQDRDTVRILATARRNRLQSNGRPRFDLTEDEFERSTKTAMRLADASKSQAEARLGANTTLPA